MGWGRKGGRRGGGMRGWCESWACIYPESSHRLYLLRRAMKRFSKISISNCVLSFQSEITVDGGDT